MTASFLTHLECGRCGRIFDADRLWNLCPDCGKPLLARFETTVRTFLRNSPAAKDRIRRKKADRIMNQRDLRVMRKSSSKPFLSRTRLEPAALIRQAAG